MYSRTCLLYPHRHPTTDVLDDEFSLQNRPLSQGQVDFVSRPSCTPEVLSVVSCLPLHETKTLPFDLKVFSRIPRAETPVTFGSYQTKILQ